MIEQLNEQLQKSLKPVTDLATVNARAMEQLVEKQTLLFTALVNDGISFTGEMAKQKEAGAMIDAQKAYVECVQEKLMDASKASYEILCQAQEKASDVYKNAFKETQTAFTAADK